MLPPPDVRCPPSSCPRLPAQDAGTAKKLAFAREVSTRCITLEGDDFNPGGTLTGGSRNKGNSVLVRWKGGLWSELLPLGDVDVQDGPKIGAKKTCNVHLPTCLSPRSVAPQARLHELAQAEEGLAAAQAAMGQAQAALKAMAAAAQQYKKWVWGEGVNGVRLAVGPWAPGRMQAAAACC